MQEDIKEKGNISIHTENIFPIIKKFLYSDQEVFLRELVSNAVDATQKLKQLASLNTYTGAIDELTINIKINEKLKTITISDRGIGMTGTEVKKYINQIAFSGATEFVEKHQKKDLIGFFGLGFYAAFMVADMVEIHTKSYQENAEAVRWSCDGTTNFTLSPTIKKQIGTDIILYINEEAKEYLEKAKIQNILEKYCKFLPIPIQFDEKIINETAPLWTKQPNEIKEDAYIAFYKKLYPFNKEALFWIHLNVDYPFHLTGILYFPAVSEHIERPKGKIQLYSKQVFITDEVNNIVPEFLSLMHGIIDSPDIPLNVSRSALQADSNVKKINTYITKKVADKLSELFKSSRKLYQEKWDSIGFFIKYGIISEEKFYERVEDCVLLKNIDNIYYTFSEYREKIQTQQTDQQQKLVLLYTTNPAEQDIYIRSCVKKGYDVLVFDSMIDTHFIGTLETKLENVLLKRVDADAIDKLISTGIQKKALLTVEQQKKLQDIYKKSITQSDINWHTAPMEEDEFPLIITLPESSQRIQKMATYSGMMGTTMPLQYDVTINTNHVLAKKILDTPSEEKQYESAKYLYNLALISQNRLSGAQLTDFLKHNVGLLTASLNSEMPIVENI